MPAEPVPDDPIAQARDALVADLLRSDGTDDAALRARLQRFADLFLAGEPDAAAIVGGEDAG